MSGGDRELRLARAYLCRAAEPPAPALAAFVAEFGPVDAAARVRRGADPPTVAAETVARRGCDRAEADLRAAELIGARLLVPEDPGWPAWQFAGFDIARDDELVAPLALWVLGEGELGEGGLGELVDRSVAVVGARAATGYGEHIAAEFGFGLAEVGFTVVSGAAIGVDGAAHRGALAAEGRTVAVLACGVDRPYPAAHAGLLQRIAAAGAVVSEYPPGAVPARHRFLVRNRIIAGLTAGTVVVEAGLRSGARRTAANASALGRPVMAVPGPVTSAVSAGCHELLRETTAVAVTRVEEVVEAVGRLGIDLAEPVGRPSRPTDGLDAVTLRVHEALAQRAARSSYRLSVEAGLSVDLVRAALPELERRGLAEQVGGAWRRRRRVAGHRPGGS